LPGGDGLHLGAQAQRREEERACRTFTGDNGDVFVTVDSDTSLEHRATEEGLKPFTDPRVQSVAGIDLAANHSQSLLVKLKSVNTLVWQLRTPCRTWPGGNVLVNRGTFALYRGDTVHACLGRCSSATRCCSATAPC
jgi:hyaluronan synthase